MPRNAKVSHYQPYQRQRPVSCHFCRSRKLRCNRESPCSNCSARGITCHLYASDIRPCATDQFGIVGRSNVPDSHDDLSQGILNRLERLEQALLSNTSTTATSTQSWTRNTLGASKALTTTPAEKGIRFGPVGKEPQLATDAELLEMECVEQCCEVRDSHSRVFSIVSTYITHVLRHHSPLETDKDVDALLRFCSYQRPYYSKRARFPKSQNLSHISFCHLAIQHPLTGVNRPNVSGFLTTLRQHF